MRWTALVPLKGGPGRKSRLAPHLSPAERMALSEHMARHVCSVLADVPGIERTLLLSPVPLAGVAGWQLEEGRDLNSALEAALAKIGLPLLVIHADLPCVLAHDISALLEAAEQSGVALAPDRHGEGTNAVALAVSSGFRFAFGAGSFHRHKALAGHGVATVARRSLALDVDTADDLAAMAQTPYTASTDHLQEKLKS